MDDSILVPPGVIPGVDGTHILHSALFRTCDHIAESLYHHSLLIRSEMENTVPPVDAAAPFDLVTYIDRYPAGSETRLQRLLFIAFNNNNNNNKGSSSSFEVSAQALRLVELHFRETQNVRSYKQVFGGGDKGQPQPQPGGGGGGAGVVITYDAAWVQDTERSTQSALETLEARLSAAQAQLQKEAIRTAYLAIGDFLVKQGGDLPAALRAIMRSREYCTTRAQTAHACLQIIEMAMNMSKCVPGTPTIPLDSWCREVWSESDEGVAFRRGIVPGTVVIHMAVRMISHPRDLL